MWFDDRNVTLARRILFDQSDALSLEEDHEDGMVELRNGQGDSIFAVDTVARPALEFMIRTKHFFVRELPGDLDDAQRIAMVSVMVEKPDSGPRRLTLAQPTEPVHTSALTGSLSSSPCTNSRVDTSSMSTRRRYCRASA